MVQIPPISFISSYFANVFLCARLHVRSLSNIKAYIHHRVCVCARTRVYDEPDLIISQGDIACFVSPSLVQNASSINWVHANARSDINSMAETHVKRCSNPPSSAAAQLSYWPPQEEELNCKWKNRTERSTHGQRSAFSSRRVWFRWLTPVFRSGCDVGESVLCYWVPVMGVTQRCVFVGELIMFISFNPK